jgi:hypothetical protein
MVSGCDGERYTEGATAAPDDLFTRSSFAIRLASRYSKLV